MRLATPRLWIPASVVFLAAALLTGALVGPVHLGVLNVVHATFAHVFGLHSPLSGANDAILWQLRLPRVVLGALVGGTLAAAGAAYQGVFRNPLRRADTGRRARSEEHTSELQSPIDI